MFPLNLSLGFFDRSECRVHNARSDKFQVHYACSERYKHPDFYPRIYTSNNL